MAATLRYRGDKNNLVEFAKNLDAFKKVPEKYTETTEIGGTLSLISRLFIVYLIFKEIRYYRDANLIFQFEPDIDMDVKVHMHVDITMAMPCTSLRSVEVMDETQEDIFTYGMLQGESVHWEMLPEQRANFERMQITNHYLREQYHSVADILFKDIIRNEDSTSAPVNKTHSKAHEEHNPPDACRFFGTLEINKVAGVLCLVGGAHPFIDIQNDHWTIEMRRVPTNFTHRINRLSFGQYAAHVIQPLEGDETHVPEEATTVQYFLKVVPTEVHKTFTTINTYQYSVTENMRKLDSERNSYGSPGIYFKYDWSALKIVVRTDRENIIQFVIRLCSIVAGIIVISGILNTLLVAVQRRLLRILAPQHLQAYKILQETNSPAPTIATTAPTITANDLISIANKMSISNGTATIAPAPASSPFMPNVNVTVATKTTLENL